MIQEIDITKYFTIVKTLGKGSYGIIEKVIAKNIIKNIAKNIEPNTEYAMKIVKSDTFKDTISIMKEFNILRQLDNENVIKTYALFKGKDINNPALYYFIMELLDIDLFDYAFDDKELNLGNIKDIMINILRGLSYLHQPQPLYQFLESTIKINSYIVHLDLKLENIMLKLKGNEITQIKIIDVGLAEIVRAEKKGLEGGDTRGSPEYVAPEIICMIFEHNCPSYGRPSDIWSCGIIFFGLLFKGWPFEGIKGKEANESLRHIYEQMKEYKKNPEIYSFGGYFDSVDIKNDYGFIVWYILRQMLEYDPVKRITVEDILEMFHQIKEKLSYIGSITHSETFYESHMLQKKLQRKLQRRYEDNEFMHFGMDFGERNTNKLFWEPGDGSHKCRILCKLGHNIYFFCSHILNKKELFAHLVQNADSLQQGQTLLCNECAAKNL